VNAHHSGEDTLRRNRRTALVLVLLAAAFMIGFILKIWLK